LSRILLVCPEPLGHGQPAGIGIRFIEMARALRDDGHSVSVLSADGGSVAGCECAATSPETLRRVSERSDAAIVQGHGINDFAAHAAATIPTVIDLYDPFIIENLHYYGERGAEVFTHDHHTLMRSMMRGDVFLCASESQRLFYLGILLATGRLNPVTFDSDPHFDALLRIVPFGVQPPRLRIRRAAPPAILFGGIYDWYDPILAIDAVALARREIPGLTLTFTRHPNPEITPQGKAAEAWQHVQQNGFDFVRFEPWVAYDARGDFFDRHALALLTFPQSIETDLSMRTRIYDYLWGGLPIITSSAPGTDGILARYDAGVVVRGDDAASFAATIVATLREERRYAEMMGGTDGFVRDHQWSETLEPLLAFCRNPGADVTRDAFLFRLNVQDRSASFLDRIRRRIGGRA
jgi:glycosyltransferase involved in cell wall biosynthesis